MTTSISKVQKFIDGQTDKTSHRTDIERPKKEREGYDM